MMGTRARGLACFALLLAGCGGGSGVDCPVFVACGGDLVGAWEIDGVCQEAEPAECPGSRFSQRLSMTGTISFGPDMTYTQQTTAVGSISIHAPAACIPDDVESCSDSGLDCTGTPQTACDCSSSSSEEVDTSGSYQLIGTTTLATDDGFYDFCVDGDTLRLQGSDDAVIVLSRVPA